MTTATASSLPEILDTDDGLTYPRAAALKATRLFLETLMALHETTDLKDISFFVIDKLADLLGGEHWGDIAEGLLDEVLAEDAAA